MSNINDDFFDGLYKDVWKALIPAELTQKEVDFMIPYFGLDEKSQVLDMMCGYGRHAIALAEKGIRVTAVDNLTDYIREIKKTADERSLPITAVLADAAGYEANKTYDLAICMGNSLNFFNAADVEKILKNTTAHLKPGGHLLVNSWSLAEIAIPRFKEQSSGEIAGIKMESFCRQLSDPIRIETVTTMTGLNGEPETKTAVDYIFTIAEMEMLITRAGLQLLHIYSVPPKKEFVAGDPRAYIIAQKK